MALDKEFMHNAWQVGTLVPTLVGMMEIDQTIGDRADDTVRSTIKALVAGRGILPEEVARAVGMPRTTFYRKLRGEGSRQAFRAGEVAALAAFFGVRVADIYDGVAVITFPRVRASGEPAVYPAAAA